LEKKNKKGNIAPVPAGLTSPRAHQREEGNSRNAYKEEMNENGAKESEDKGECEQNQGKTTPPFSPLAVFSFFFKKKMEKMFACPATTRPENLTIF
jgi:hypothetical protein